MERILPFAKKNWKYILTALIALIIGGTFGPSGEEHSAVLTKNDDSFVKGSFSLISKSSRKM